MRKYRYLLIIIVLFRLNVVNVNASSGRLKKDSIIVCNNIMYGQHGDDNHHHIAEKKGDNYYPVGDAIYSNPCNLNNETNNVDNTDENTNGSYNNSFNEDMEDNKINKNNTLNNQETNNLIDNNDLNKSDNVKTNDISNNNENKELKNNEIINRVNLDDNKISDTKITVNINKKEVNFENNKAKVYVDSITKKLIVEYKLNNPNASINISSLDSLSLGNNTLLIEVTDNGKMEKYEITIYKYSKSEEDIIMVVGFGILVLIIVGIYLVVKKIVAGKN